MNFQDKLQKIWDEKKFVCVGLDSSDLKLIQNVVDQTHDLVCAYKINSAFFEQDGATGLESLKKIISHIHENYPELPVILDCKRGDIGNTNEAYAKSVFDDLQADAVTVHPYLGKESLKPFLNRADKGIFVLVKTSNPGSGEFQDLKIGDKPLYQVVAEHVKTWGENNNLGVVVGATYPAEIGEVRKIVDDMPILVPGVGAQGGDLAGIIKNGLNSKKQGLIINSSRAIIFADNPRKACEDLHTQIQEILSNV